MIEPFRFEGGHRAGVLLVHGFTGSPEEMRSLGGALAADGLLAVGPRLPGHGLPGRPERSDRAVWRAEVERALTDLRAALPPGRPVIGIGLSMGSLLVLEQATRPEAGIDAIVALAPALHLGRSAAALLAAARGIGPLHSALPLMSKGPSDIRDPVALAAHPAAEPFPVGSAVSFDELRRQVSRLLPRVRQPLLVIHGAQDLTCAPASADRLVSRVGSSWIEKHVLPESGHVVTVDRERECVARLVRDFVSRHLGRGALD